MEEHRHKAEVSSIRAFMGTVSKDENRAAHGNICIVETCSCGKIRKTNVNGKHTERGVWYTP